MSLFLTNQRKLSSELLQSHDRLLVEMKYDRVICFQRIDFTRTLYAVHFSCTSYL